MQTILEQIDQIDLNVLDQADLYLLAAKLQETAQRAAVAMLERVGQP